MIRLTPLLLIALTLAPSAQAWFGGTPFFAPIRHFDADPFDVFDSAPALRRSARSILREADRAFRSLDNMLNTIAEATETADESVASQTSGIKIRDKKLEGNKNETAVAKANVELRLRPSFEWKATDDGFILTGILPGLTKDDLSVEVVDAPHKAGGSYIVVTGESKKESKAPSDEGKEGKVVPFEFHATYKKFEQRVKLPEGVDKNSLTAKFENGLLQIYMAYAKEVSGERKKITID